MHTDSKRLIYNGKLPMYTSVEQILCKFEMTEEVLELDFNGEIRKFKKSND